MWLINFLPEFVVHILLMIGILGTIAGFVLGFIPIINKYKLPIQIISLLILSFSVYLQGGLAEKKKWELRVKDMEAQVARAEAASQAVNTEIVTQVVTEKEYIRLRGEKVIEYIDREIKVLDEKCILPEAAITAHNMAANNDAGEKPNE